MTIRVAVIGTGYMGRNHARVVKSLSDSMPVTLSSLVDVDVERARRVAEMYGGRVYASVDNMLGEEVPDAAIIAVPTRFHVEVALKLLERGVEYLLVEKPVATSSMEAERILEAAGPRRAERIMVGHIERFNPVVEHLIRSLGKGTLGRVISSNARRVGPYTPRIRDTGVVLDLATHEIDLARLIFGAEPIEVYARTYRVVNEHYEDAAHLILKFPEGSAAIEVNRVTPYKERRLLLTGTKAVAHLNYIEQSLRIYNAEWEMVSAAPREEPLMREDAAFLEAAVNGGRVPVTLLDGLKAVIVAEKALESAATGRVVEISFQHP